CTVLPPPVPTPRDAGQPPDLVKRVDHDVPDPDGHGPLELAAELVAPVQRDHPRPHSGLQRDLELAAGAHVDAEALLADPAQHGPAAERLRRVEHPGLVAERLAELP